MNLDLNCVRRYLDEVIDTEMEKVIDFCSNVGQERSFDQSQQSEEIHQREQRLHRDRQRKAEKRRTESTAEREKRLRINRECMERRINKKTAHECEDLLCVCAILLSTCITWTEKTRC